jgi:uncharacterized repeat protein (TIGR02543 family)
VLYPDYYNLFGDYTYTRDGYTFGGWYREAAFINEWDFDTDVVTSDMTLYAKWTRNRNNAVPVILINGDSSSANPRIGDTLTFSFASFGSEYSYVWKLGGAVVGAANKPYTVTAEDIGGAITLEITEFGEIYKVRAAAVTKGAIPKTPNAPVIEYVTYSTVKLAGTDGYEYRSSADWKWQESPIFNGLTPDTWYQFYQRVAETKTAYASFESEGNDTLTNERPVKTGARKLFVKIRNRPEVPEVQEEAAAAAPSVRLSGEFTAGPNPVSKQSGIINFYRQGKQVASCELRIYDANGNVINNVKITDMPIDNQLKRKVGSWDLCDKNGRTVSEGTYLVKGVVKTVDGKIEKISLIISVR